LKGIKDKIIPVIPAPSTKDWLIERKGYRRIENSYYESLFTLSNGYMGVRNTIDFEDPNSIPGIFIAGLYDNAPVVYTELANVPSWLKTDFSISLPDSCTNAKDFELVDGQGEFYQALDMKKGALYTTALLSTRNDQKIRVETFQFPHALYKELYFTVMKVRSVDSEGRVSVAFSLNNSMSNQGLYPWVKTYHFKTLDAGPLEYEGITIPGAKRYGIYMKSRTQASRLTLTQMTLTIPAVGYRNLCYEQKFFRNRAIEIFTLDLEKDKEYTFYRLVHNSVTHDSQKGENVITDRNKAGAFFYHFRGDMERLVETHLRSWEEKWEDAWIYLEGDEKALESIRFSVFQLLQAYDEKCENFSIPAKGLTGEGYKGHIFWDTEIFMFPFYLHTNPQAARKLLAYRTERMPVARENAEAEGMKGVRFPWESASTGREVTPYEIYDFVEEKKYFIYTGKEELHVTADIAYTVVRYYNATGDDTFMLQSGLPLLVETARYWASRVEWDEEKKGFVIRKVIGPDEFHEHVNNSYFTNYMASWNLKEAVKFAKLYHIPSLSEEEIERWEEIAEGIYLPQNESGILEEFEGYFDLEDIKITQWDSNYMPIIPKEVEKRIEKTKLIKQGDVVLLFYLHPNRFSRDVVEKNFHYYETRTVHSSSLSPMVYSIVGLHLGIEDSALKNFMRTSRVDLDDNQGNIRLGLHLAACGGTWQAVIGGFGGVIFNEKELILKPRLPESWKLLQFRIRWKGNRIKVTVTNSEHILELEEYEDSHYGKGSNFITVTIDGNKVQLDRKTKKRVVKNISKENKENLDSSIK